MEWLKQKLLTAQLVAVLCWRAIVSIFTGK